MTRTSRAPRPLRARSIAAALIAAALSVTVIATPAQAADPDIRVTFENDAQSVEFGDSWDLTAKTKYTACYRSYTNCTNALTLTFTGDNGQTQSGTTTVYTDERAYFGNSRLKSALPAGKYKIRGKFKYPWLKRTPTMSAINAPGNLEITPAPLAIDFRIETDANQSAGAVVNAQLTGKFITGIEECQSYEGCHEPLPNGTWTFAIKGSDGEILTEKTIETTGNAGRFASFYWHDVPAGSDYTATARFAPTAAAAGNFTIDSAGEASFTSPDAIAVGEPGAPEEPVVEVVVEEDSSIPLWSVLAWLAGLALLAVLVIVFAVLAARQRRRRAKSLPTVATPEAGL